MKSSKIVLKVLIGSTFLVVGFYLGAFGVHPSNLLFEASINFADLIAPLFSLLAAVFVVVFIEQKISKSKSSRGLIVSYLGEIDSLANQLTAMGSRCPLNEVNPKLKSMKSIAVTAKEIVGRFSCGDDILDQLAELAEKINELRKLMTESPVRVLEEQADVCNTKVKDGIMELAAERAALIEIKISDIKKLTIKIQTGIIEF